MPEIPVYKRSFHGEFPHTLQRFFLVVVCVVQPSSGGLLWYLPLPKADRRPRRKHAKIKIEIEKNAFEILPM